MKNQRPITLSGVIRKRLPQIEARMYEGVKQRVIVDELAAEGFTVTIRDFRVLLHRARKAKKPTSQIDNSVVNTELKKEPEKQPEKQIEKTSEKPKQVSKVMSKQELQDMLNSDIDLDAL